jgi:hypothetical protein
MRERLVYTLVFVLALGLAACGRSDKTEVPPETPASTAVAVEPDPDPKFIGAPNAQWQTAGDAIRDDTLVRDVTFVADGRGAMVEVAVRPTDAAVRVQLLNNEGAVLGETNASAGQEVQLRGQATGGNRNMVRIIRGTRTSTRTPFTVRIRTVPEAN